MYSIRPILWNIKSAPAGPGRSRVGPALYVFSLLGTASSIFLQLAYKLSHTVLIGKGKMKNKRQGLLKGQNNVQGHGQRSKPNN
jgi:hypothetical protein